MSLTDATARSRSTRARHVTVRKTLKAADSATYDAMADHQNTRSLTRNQTIEATPIDTAPALPAKRGNYARSSLNATRHGILSRHTCLPWENQAAFNSLLDGLISEYQPKGAIEEHLIIRIAQLLWRARRVVAAEAAVHHRVHQMAHDAADAHDAAHKERLANRELVHGQVLAGAFILDQLERLGRYETHLNREVGRSLSMLLRLREICGTPQQD